MQESQKNTSRKKFLLWTAALVTSVTALKFIPGTKKKKSDTVKMLAQDGTLVEIDIDKIPGTKRKNVTDHELQAWIKK